MALEAKATQDFVPIKEVRDGIVILKDGGVRSILMASSVNLSLKSYDEQKATIIQFQSFLNSLDFPTQIVIQSRKLDIRPYLTMLEAKEKEQLEPLLKIQTREYIEFIRQFTEAVAIMTKNFFIVVPYSGATIDPQQGFKSLLNFGKSTPANAKKEAQADFEEQRTQLEQRMGVIIQGLSRIGVRTVQLGTEEIIEIFYKAFNPGDISGSMHTETK